MAIAFWLLGSFLGTYVLLSAIARYCGDAELLRALRLWKVKP
jgi:hypothetical protein